MAECRKTLESVSRYIKSIGIAFLVGVLSLAQAGEERRVPTHADAAFIFAKFSGLFDRYVAADATLTECVSFLNKHGIYFGLMDVVNGSEFTLNDCARVMGQIELVFTGEAEFVAGKVILPMGIDSWEEFCMLNGIEYVQGYEGMVQTLNSGSE